MRLSFYSGLALAMIAADTAKAQEKKEDTTLAHTNNMLDDEDQDDWALSQSESKADSYSDIEAKLTADTGTDIDLDSEADVWSDVDSEVDSEADVNTASEIESEVDSEADVYAESDIENESDIDLESENEEPGTVLAEMGFSEEQVEQFTNALAQTETGADAEAEAQWGFVRRVWRLSLIHI